MTDTPSFQDLLDDFAGEVFVGRGEELSLFENALKATRPPFLILDISGQGGVGKSTLLERYHQIARDHHAAFGLVSEDHLEVPKILDTFATQLQEDGLDFDKFKERYRKYLELKEKVEADPKAPSGLLDFAIRGATKVGIKSLKRIPIAGDVADVFLNEDATNAIAEETSALTKYIYQKFTNKDERVLLTDTDSELTKHFLADLTNSIKKEKAILCFDTYEKTADHIEKWMINLLSGEYGKFSGNTLIVIAGRFPLGQRWMKFKKATRQVELKEFTEEEAKDYLTRSGITDEKLISQFIEISEKLPVLLALLVSSPNQMPHDVSGDAVQRFLQGLSIEKQEAALISSLPRYFNIDILSALLGNEEGKKAFEWLSKAHFVRTSENGWMYHDVVRTMMFRYFRLRSFGQFIKAQSILEEYYKKHLNDSGNDASLRKVSNATKDIHSERLYHFLHQNPAKQIEIAAQQFLGGFCDAINKFSELHSNSGKNMESFELLVEIYEKVLLKVADEISDFEKEELCSIYKEFAGLSSGDAGITTKLLDWMSEIPILKEDEKNSLALIYGIILADSDEVGNAENAVNYFNKYVELNPNMGFAYFARGQYYFDNNKYEKAVSDFSKAVELQPENGGNYYSRGRTYYYMDDYLNALPDFSKAIELQPKDGDIYYLRGRTYYFMEDYPDALPDFSKAIELQPKDGDIYYMRGLTYYFMKDYPNALPDFSKAVEMQPETGYNYYWRGRTYYFMEDYPNALPDFSKAIELQPEDGYNYYWHGRTYYFMEDYPNALPNFSKAIELQPENGYNYYWRGRTYYFMEDYPNALLDFSKAVEMQPETGYNYYWRGRTYYFMEDYPNALLDFSKAIELQPETGYNYYWRGLTYYFMEDYPNALPDFSKAIDLQPKDGYNYYWRGLTYYFMEDYPNALPDFSKAIELQPEDGDNYNRRGLTYYKMQDYPAAIADFSKVIGLQPDNRTPYFNRGDTHYQMEDYPAALADFSKTIELQPDNGDNYYWRGMTYYAMKNYLVALIDLSKAIELQPENGFNYYRLSLCNFALGRIEGYKESVRATIKLFEQKDEKSWYEKLILALCYFANQDLEKSKILYSEIADQCSKKDILEYGLENLKEFIDLAGETPESKEIEKILQETLEK